MSLPDARLPVLMTLMRLPGQHSMSAATNMDTDLRAIGRNPRQKVGGASITDAGVGAQKCGL